MSCSTVFGVTNLSIDRVITLVFVSCS